MRATSMADLVRVRGRGRVGVRVSSVRATSTADLVSYRGRVGVGVGEGKGWGC